MRSFIDQLGNTVTLTSCPSRIISLVPSQTELLADLNLDAEVVGITKFCKYPLQWQKAKTIVGGTKTIDVATIKRLNPDLIIANKEENEKSAIEALQRHIPVWISDVATLNDALSMIRSVSSLTCREQKGEELIGLIGRAFSNMKPPPEAKSRSALYLIWRKPWMAAGSGTFIDAMLAVNGLVNSVAAWTRYPELSSDEITRLNPEFIFLSSEPYPFREKHLAEMSKICPSAKIILVDGEMFSWYGSHLLHAPGYFKGLPL